MRRLRIAIQLVVAAAVSSASAQSMDPDEPDFDPVKRMQRFYPDWQPPKVDQEELARHPLGSAKHPIRVQGVKGTHAYFARLRCPDGKVPGFKRHGSGLRGVFGYPVDFYELTCPATAPTSVVVDIYHPRFVESEPVPGFTLAQ